MSEEYYFQKGGARQLPFRWFNPNAQAFAPCSYCGKQKRPSKKQQGGSINMPYRYFNPNAQAFSPCSTCDGPQQNKTGLAVYANDFMRSQGCHDYNSCNMTSGDCQGCGGKKAGCCGAGCGPRCGCVDCGVQKQKGGNPTGAPLTVFTGTTPLKYNFKLEDTFNGLPVFDKI